MSFLSSVDQQSGRQLRFWDDNELIHSPDRRGFFSIFRKFPNSKPKQNSYPLERLQEIVDAIGDTPDCYISQGEFTKPNRRTVNLLRIGVCWVDLDYYKENSPFRIIDQLIDAFLLFCSDEGLPLPSLIIDSGRGAYAKWILNRTVPAVVLPRWNAVQRLLVSRVEGFGADPRATDCSRVLRLIGSRNSKSNKHIEVVWTNPCQVFYDFEDLAVEVLPQTREEFRKQYQPRNLTAKQQELFKVKEKQFNADRRVVRHLFNPYTLNWNRLIDLRQLVKLRGWTSPPKGMQDKFLFFATCFLSWSMKPARLYHEIEQLAFEFAPEWTVSEIRGVLSTTMARARQAENGGLIEYEAQQVDPRYRYSNDRLIEELDITDDEQRKMLTIIGKREKYDRKNVKRSNERRDEYEGRAAKRRAEAKQLRNQGLKWKDVGERLGISAGAARKLTSR